MNNTIKTRMGINQAIKCPSCGREGKPVKTITLHSLIKKERQGDITDARCFFCDAQGCDLVYFTEDGSHPFYKDDLTVRVGVKEVSAPRPICYCFNHTVEEIYDEIERTGKTTVIDNIKTHMKDGCSCETKNPQSSCCLERVRHFVNDAFYRFGKDKNVSVIEEIPKDCCKPSGQILQDTKKMATFTQTTKSNRFNSFAPAAILSAILASVCCVGPFVLIMLGVSGAWLGNLRALSPYRPVFILISVGLLITGFYRVYKKPKESCEPGTLCALPQTKRAGKVVIWSATVIVVLLIILPYLIGLLA